MSYEQEKKRIDVTTAESKVLGVIFNRPKVLYDIHRRLSNEMFSLENHSIIYSKIDSLFADNFLPDTDMVASYLKSAGLLDRVGGEDYIYYLKNLPEENDYSNIKYYVDIINKAFKSREILKISKYVQTLENNQDAVESVITNIKERIDFVDTKGFKSNASRISEFLPGVWKQLREKIKNPGIPGISTGYTSVDSITGGYRGGSYWIIGGRPSHGKTAFILNSMLDVARRGKKVLIFSLEMNEQQISERLISLVSGIDHIKVMLGQMEEAEIQQSKEAMKELNKLPIYISTTYDLDANEISRDIREHVIRHGIEVVFIDYIQLTTERETDAVHSIGRISRMCKLMSKEFDIFIGVVSQLSRRVEQRDNKRPIMSDLRQSGNLEEDADLVAFIYRDEVYNKDDEKVKGLLEFIVAKHRNGPVGMLPMEFKHNTMRVLDGK